MNQGKYILVNGAFVPTDECRISISESEAFLFSEKIRAIRSAFPFFSETLEMIKLKLLIFNQSLPEFTDREGSGLRRQLERTLTKNKHFLGSTLTLTFRLSDQKIHYTIQSEKLDNIGFSLNEKGLYIGIFDKIQKSAAPLSNLSLGSEVYWHIVKNHLNDSTVDELLILNTDNQIIETPESNIYTITGKKVRGASNKQGAYMDISRSLMLDIFEKLDLGYAENEGITVSQLRNVEEILIVNALEGIRWVVGFEEKRFFNNTIRKISELFNQNGIN